MTTTHAAHFDTLIDLRVRSHRRRTSVALGRDFTGHELLALGRLEHEPRQHAPPFTHNEAVGLGVAAVWVDDGVSGRIGGSESDAAARRGQGRHVVCHNSGAISGNFEANLFGAEGGVEDVHLEVGARTFEEDVVIADIGAAFVLSKGGFEAFCWDD